MECDDVASARNGRGTGFAIGRTELRTGDGGSRSRGIRRCVSLTPIEAMKTKDITRLALLLALAPLTPVAFAQKEEATKKEKAEVTKTTTTTTTEVKATVPAPGSIAAAVNDGATFSILSKAIKAAELEELLGSKGTYTVFAPTDEAFGKLKEGTLDKLLLPENKEKLRSLILFHVIPGQFISSSLKDEEVKTSNGEKVKVDVDGKTVKVDKAKVSQADVMATNGVIHTIDKVLVPKSLDGFAGLDE